VEKIYNEIVQVVAEFWENPPANYQIFYGWESLEAKRLRALVQIQVKQQRPWVIGFPRWLANVYGNCPDVNVRRMLLEDMMDEDLKDPTEKDGHVGLHRKMALALGLTDEDINNGPFVPEVLGNYYSMSYISRHYPWLEALACVMGVETLTMGHIPALYPDMIEWKNPRGGGVIGPTVEMYRKIGLTRDDLGFIWAHQREKLDEWEGKTKANEARPRGSEAKHQAYIIKTLTEHTKTPEEQKRVSNALRLGVQLYWLRWNGVGRVMRQYLETGDAGPYGPTANTTRERGQEVIGLGAGA